MSARSNGSVLSVLARRDSWRALGRAVIFLLAYAFSIAAASLPVGVGYFLFSKEIEHDELREISLHMEDALLWLSTFATLLTLLAIFVFAFLALRYLDRRGGLRDLGFAWTTSASKVLVASIGVAIVLVVIFFWMASALGQTRVTDFAWQREAWGDVLLDFAGYALLLGSMVVAEELVFRGYIRFTLTDALTPRGALIASAILFALWRALAAYATPLAVLNAFIAGLILGGLYLISNTLWVPIAAHLAWTFVSGFVFSLPVAGMAVEGLVGMETASGLLIGGKYGPDGSVLGLIALGVAGVMVWMRARQRV